MKTLTTANARVREWLRGQSVSCTAAFAAGHLEQARERLELVVIGLEATIRADEKSYRWATAPLADARRMKLRAETMLEQIAAGMPVPAEEFSAPIGQEAS